MSSNQFEIKEDQGTCYAQSAACIKEWQEYRDYGFKGQFLSQFFYNNRENIYDDNENNDNGMYSRDVMKLLTTMGIYVWRILIHMEK